MEVCVQVKQIVKSEVCQLARVLCLDYVMLVCQEVEVPMAQVAQDGQDSSV